MYTIIVEPQNLNLVQEFTKAFGTSNRMTSQSKKLKKIDF